MQVHRQSKDAREAKLALRQPLYVRTETQAAPGEWRDLPSKLSPAVAIIPSYLLHCFTIAQLVKNIQKYPLATVERTHFVFIRKRLQGMPKPKLILHPLCRFSLYHLPMRSFFAFEGRPKFKSLAFVNHIKPPPATYSRFPLES